MKAFIFSLLALTALGLTFFVATSYGQAPRPGDVKIEKIIPSVLKTPDYAVNGTPPKRFRPGDWLEVEVEFQTVPELMDELTFNYKILINNQLLVGSIDHINIPKGREHYSVAYVSPRALEAVMGGKNLTSAAIQNIMVEVSKQGQLISTLSAQKTAMPNVKQLQGLVLKKSETPFAPLWYDRYEALKPMSR